MFLASLLIDQLFLQIVTATNTTVPVVATTGTTTSLSDLIGQIVNQMGTLIGLLSALFATPGAIALFKIFNRNKERNAIAETTGIAASKVLDLQEQIVTITKLLDAIIQLQGGRESTGQVSDQPLPKKPTVEELEKKVENLKAQLNDVTPRLPPVTKASLRQN